MKTKKVLALILSSLFVLSTFAGCGNKAANTTASDTTQKKEYNGIDISKPVELTMYLPVNALRMKSLWKLNSISTLKTKSMQQ